MYNRLLALHQRFREWSNNNPAQGLLKALPVKIIDGVNERVAAIKNAMNSFPKDFSLTGFISADEQPKPFDDNNLLQEVSRPAA